MVERGRDGEKTEERKETNYDKRDCQRKERNRKEMTMPRGEWYLRLSLVIKSHGQKQPGEETVCFILQLAVHP